MTRAKLRVAICGGGIGGLTLALVLQKYSNNSVEVDLYEAKDKFAEIGAGLTVWKRTWFIIQALGLDKALGDIAVKPPTEGLNSSFTFRRADQCEGCDFYTIVAPFGTTTVHRADMLKIMTDSISSDTGTHLRKKLVGYHQDEAGLLTLSFADGTSTVADVLVGADGLKSVTRKEMYGRLAKGRDAPEAEKIRGFIEPTWTGMYAYRALVDSEKLLKISPGHESPQKPILYFGRTGHLVSYPISKGRFVNFVSLVSHPDKEGTRPETSLVKEVAVGELKGNHEGWENHVQNLLSCVETCTRWAIYQNRDIPHYTFGNVALLGDAAHAMTPNLGAGAGQAMEDAYVLGRLLSEDSMTEDTVPKALETYDIVRRPVASKVAGLSRMCGDYYKLDYIPNSVRDAIVDFDSVEGLKLRSESIYSAWSFNWTGLPEDEWVQARNVLKDLLHSKAE